MKIFSCKYKYFNCFGSLAICFFISQPAGATEKIVSSKISDPSKDVPVMVVNLDAGKTLSAQGVDMNAALHAVDRVFGDGPAIRVSDEPRRSNDLPDKAVGPVR